MNEIVDEMNYNEFKSIITTELFDKMDKMIEERKLSMKNAILLLKHAGYCRVIKNIWLSGFQESSLNRSFEKMIVEEEQKKEEKNEKLMIDLCECYISLRSGFPPELLSICVPCLLKIALKKEENEEIQKEVEIALMALRNVSDYHYVEQELYLNKITEIIQYHQEHRNLTRVAYQSAWQFLMNKFYWDKSLEEVIANELHFTREAARELEELMKCVDWKKNEDKLKEMEEKNLLERWLETVNIYFGKCQLRNEERAVLIESIVQVYRVAKDNHREICEECIRLLKTVSYNTTVEIEDLLKSGAVNIALGEIVRFDFMKTSVEDWIFGGYVLIQYVEDYFVHC
ncbi:uncharacterized protein MONOS_9721 [Monocercomonoides exilis]|uniref:uncharacterized protein n=1 Tax=Monocercomonoides exilis TaxID=2049356 RepID=UPI00355A36FB|nr:hypothetical protein MONOS_9721 [Monocercomonoides exilis]|eukprot:MONOS_9721.1-p1 / transcript=MONOS_9721.1 / gene=MONOS_9721 / organism=Monocercomonoides_exilis_PA203 / gene_product=unspecified product / transcript_product=unspecified product / location=Mono_scaffold00412:6985-8237(-) / protein_length=343 / sequence_SO=supercontig / SO=protein_coding / is_pseudo=false